jgi:CHAT domain-containing protein/tetratricopeptide (TPR) repeat protein
MNTSWKRATVSAGLAASLMVISLAAQQSRLAELSKKFVALQAEKRYAAAIPVAKEAVEAAEITFGKDSPQFANYLHYVAGFLKNQGDCLDAEGYYRRTQAIMEKTLGKSDANVAAVNNNLAEVYRLEGRYREAEPLFLEALEVLEKDPKRGLDFAASLNNLGLVYEAQGRLGEAEPKDDLALELRTRLLGPGHALVADSLNNLGQLRRDQGKYAEAAVLYRRALRIYNRGASEDTPESAATYANLGAVYSDQGRYAEAEQQYRRALALDEKASGANHPDVATDLNNLAALFHSQDKYGEAEQLYPRALKIDEEAFPGPNPAVARDVSNLAMTYQEQGRYRDAEQAYRKALDIDKQALGEHHPDMARILNNAGALCEQLGEPGPCEPFYQRSLAIDEEVFGKSHLAVAANLNNLGQFYVQTGKLAEAEPLLRRALEIVKTATDREGVLQGRSLSNLGSLYQKRGKYAEAESAYQQALAVSEAVLGKNSYGVARIEHNLATTYYEEGKTAQAGAAWDHSLSVLQDEFEKQFAYMSEDDRLSFIATVNSEFPLYLSFCFGNRERQPEFVAKMYDLELWRKGLVVNGITAVRSKIASSGDKEALAMFSQLAALRGQLAKLRNPPDANLNAWKEKVRLLQERTNTLEAALVQRSQSPAKEKIVARATWQDVKKALQPGEAAVEFIHFPFHDGHRWTGKSYYAALVVTAQENRNPTLVFLGEGNELEQGAFADYQALVRTKQPDPEAGLSFYRSFWKPLETALEGIHRVYVSPDAILNQVSWAPVPTAAGHLLTENVDIDVMLSTKDLLTRRPSMPAQTAVLIGNPDFNLSEADQRSAVAALRTQAAQRQAAVTCEAAAPGPGPRGGTRSSRSATGALDPLPDTEIELNAIRCVLQEKGWQIDTYMGESALKEVLQQVNHPRVLHVATHGFFEADLEASRRGGDDEHPLNDPMLRSGLYLAGANRAHASGAAAPDPEDAVLTAYEATGLDLQGTELVVMSACDTGLGVVSNGEGVFGLRRALQEAGADAVLMSMWPVPDTQTRRVMALFYENWLSGKEKHDALHLAQQSLRQELQKEWGEAPPYYWAAFVLVGR